MQVSLHYAQEHLEDLASALDRGEEVEIARPEKPSLKLVISNPAKLVSKGLVGADGKRVLGAGRGEMIVPTWEEWKAMDKELEQLINESTLFPSEAE